MRFRRHATEGDVAPADSPPGDPDFVDRRAPGEQRDRRLLGRHRRTARDLALVALIGVLAFLGVSLYVAPVPVFSSEGTVPRVIGEELTAARAALTTAGFRVRVGETREHPSAARSVVFWQDPPAETAAPPGATVVLSVSTGREQIVVPDVVGMDQLQAERVIAAAGLRVGTRDSIVDRSELGGVVLGTRPSPGMARRLGGSVDFIVNGAAR